MKNTGGKRGNIRGSVVVNLRHGFPQGQVPVEHRQGNLNHFGLQCKINIVYSFLVTVINFQEQVIIAAATGFILVLHTTSAAPVIAVFIEINTSSFPHTIVYLHSNTT